MRRTYVLGAFLSVAACASTEGIEQELSRMRRDMHGIQTDLAKTRHQVERLEGRVTLLSLGKDAVRPAPRTQVAGAPAKAEARRARPASAAGKALPVVRLGAKAQAAPRASDVDNTWMDPEARDNGQAPVMIKLGPSSDVPDRLPVDHTVLKKKDPVLHGGAKPQSAREAYKAALDKLREDNEPQAALALFRAFVAEHGRSRLVDNAMYWGGECLYVLARYEDAIEHMRSMVERFPRSTKVPHAELRIAESWLALGDRDKGLEKLRRVADRHPTSEAARRARARLDIEGGKR